MRWNKAENAVIAMSFGVFDREISKEVCSYYLKDEIEKTVLFGRFSCFLACGVITRLNTLNATPRI